jgi:D-alanine-D-alanine ligase
MRYHAEGVALVIVAGQEYGTGSSRDWAAKGTALLGVRAVLAESFERIHRSNLIGMGVMPLRMEASIGIDERSLVRNTQQLMERVLYIHKTFGDAALAEEYIEGREFYVGVVGNQELVALPPLEMDFSGLKDGSLPVMDNKAKFDETSDRYHGTTVVLPNLEPELRARLQKVSLEAYRALRVRDYGRIDLRLTQTGEIFVIEVNANCYLEQHSEFARAAEAHGLEHSALVQRIAELAMERWKHRSSAQRKRKKARARLT